MSDTSMSKKLEIMDEVCKMKESILSKIAHEFKTPLICIVSLSDELNLICNKMQNLLNPIIEKLKMINDLYIFFNK